MFSYAAGGLEVVTTFLMYNLVEYIKIKHADILWTLYALLVPSQQTFPIFSFPRSCRFLFMCLFFPLIAHVFVGKQIVLSVLLTTDIISSEDLWPKQVSEGETRESYLLGMLDQSFLFSVGLKEEIQSLHCHCQPFHWHLG